MFFSQYLDFTTTLVVFESPSRLVRTLNLLTELYEKKRTVAVCRELTKKFEDIQRGYIEEVAAYFTSQGRVKGELVLVIGPAKAKIVEDKEIDCLRAWLVPDLCFSSPNRFSRAICH